MILFACIVLAALLPARVDSDQAMIRTAEGPVADMVFALIPGGSFTMGAPDSVEGGERDALPRQTVEIAPFQIMTTEVTQAMWESLMGDNPSHFTGDDSRPVEMVSWEDCQDFVEALNAAGDGYSYRLPSEAEWEYACRAGTTTRFYWGESGDWIARRFCWTGENSGRSTHPVAGRLPNAWGLYDMVGNVAEWCQDSYAESYDGLPLNGSVQYPGDSGFRVFRGSSWTGSLSSGASFARDDYASDVRLNYVGLRLVRTRA